TPPPAETLPARSAGPDRPHEFPSPERPQTPRQLLGPPAAGQKHRPFHRDLLSAVAGKARPAGRACLASLRDRFSETPAANRAAAAGGHLRTSSGSGSIPRSP